MGSPVPAGVRRDPEAWASALGIAREALDLYISSDVVDLHIDSFIWTRVFGYDLNRRHGTGLFNGRFYSAVDIPRAVDAMTGAVWVITTNPFRTSRGRARVFFKNLDRLVATLTGSDNRVAVVTDAAGYHAARARGQHAAFIGIQGGNALDYTLEDFDRIPGGLVIRVTLVHLSSSRIGSTSSPLKLRDRGLADFGRDYVRCLNTKRILVDLAHISRRGFFDALEVHDRSQPLVVTHTGVCGAHRHWRNVDDAQLRAIADTGGTIGVMYQSSFLGEPFWGGRAAAVVDHLEHIVNTVGADHASLGSDWDGAIVPPRDLTSCLDLPRLVHLMLDRGFHTDTVQKILGKNFLRVLEHLRG